MKIVGKILSLILITVFISSSFYITPQAATKEKQYSILIADEKGTYSYYELINYEKKAGVEITGKGQVMIPLGRISKLMKSLKYSYNTKTKQVTIINIEENKKIIFTKDSAYCTYYAKLDGKGMKKKMPSGMYISDKNSEAMVHISLLKLIVSSNGVKSFTTSDMMKAGYDTYSNAGIIVINPLKEVETLPKSTTVKNLSSTIKVTIPEGFRIPEIFTLLAQKGVCASEEYLYDAMNNSDFSTYSLVNEIDREKNKCYYLEGYLYPDTYEFYRLSSGVAVITKFLKNSETKATTEYKAKAEELSLSWEEVLIIASLIEKEAGKKVFMADVSSVIHNRLKKGMKLQLDATIFYVEQYIKPYLTEEIDRYNSDYNTYKCKALPAGPICNPGKNTIEAALNPAVTDYLFFYSDDNKDYHFSKD